ncbi:hypothetical protein [Mariniblastus fucicola]|uniref:Uncharacterized protein n=1 Tax=Mariniblastus fucicola TaxID=980251 RepID=A0A5B9P4Z6_9BACT|nr:hypothetical protein [Mariniblastus fucicola]QEG20215.1 hypothetical protein MFFC18_00620 [Mariniblastus fucicola]
MVNPYQSPKRLPTSESEQTQSWSVYHRLFASVLLTAAGALLVIGLYRVLGFEKSPSGHEVRLWLLLVFSAVLTFFCLGTSRRKVGRLANFRNTSSVFRYAIGVVGAFNLAVCSAHWLEMFMAWYSGVEYENFVLFRYPFGPYAWIYWVNVVALCLLPQTVCLHGIARRKWLVLTMLIGVFLFTAVNLRGINLMVHRNQIPSSWSQFFWG